jgi:hypothetical protein
MNKAHAAGIALLLGAAAVLGMVAATRTAGLGHAASASVSAQAGKTSSALAWRAHRLDRIEAALRRSLRSRPPKLPPIPAAVHHAAAARPPAVSSAPVAAAPPRIVYQRPPPIVVVKHHAHDDGHESGDGSDGGAGDD